MFADLPCSCFNCVSTECFANVFWELVLKVVCLLCRWYCFLVRCITWPLFVGVCLLFGYAFEFDCCYLIAVCVVDYGLDCC